MPRASSLLSQYTPCTKCVKKKKGKNVAGTSTIIFFTHNLAEVSIAVDLNWVLTLSSEQGLHLILSL